MNVSPLDDAEVRRIAALAHLALTDEEVQLFSRQLGEILEYVRQVQAVPTEGVAPMSHVGREGDGERADEPQPSLDRRAALGNAPDAAREAGYFKVPRVIG
jgi:aspartyl-tRNA(Asn)/glutamyl-tRNA(Gln) amidotransferase subunit C